MRVVVQRVKKGSVTIDERLHSSIDRGFVIFLGIRNGDTEKDAVFLADKCSALRVFEDAEGKMNLGMKDVDGSALVVSQFTLYAEALKGNRPSFTEAARPEQAEPLYNMFVERMRSNLGRDRVVTGVFRAMMDVAILNDGPVTILIESS
ncbi:MAG: D-tyrosyl-tRNA(Tyr) deacylase [Bacteroidetes bacterium]|nr:D-tyrosyl-tRNA(Tyr) deacylase [Bacteroidota bacterium]